VRRAATLLSWLSASAVNTRTPAPCRPRARLFPASRRADPPGSRVNKVGFTDLDDWQIRHHHSPWSEILITDATARLEFSPLDNPDTEWATRGTVPVVASASPAESFASPSMVSRLA